MSIPLLVVAGAAFIAWWIAMPIFFWFLRSLGFYVIVPERRAVVYTLFGKVVAVFDEPGLYSMWPRIGFRSLLVPLLGKRYVLDLRIDQTYLRSQPVNSEEGAPMGIGVWYEMFVSDPVSYLYKNADPRGSLVASVSNSTVRSLSNMPLERMLEDRHSMSRIVREEVTLQSTEWGYQVGSVYVRKVHFRDIGMIRQIEQKVVNRLRQVTAAIQQDGSNRVNIIRSGADREAAIELAKAAVMRPRIVGAAIAKIAERPEVSKALFDVLEVQTLARVEGLVVQIIPEGAGLLGQLLASDGPPPVPR